MKLQYLGDARDAFKWDLLHWLCTKSLPIFDELLFVPLLTMDIPQSTEGRTPHRWFECQNFIRPFLEELRQEPRSLMRIIKFATAQPNTKFRVSIFGGERIIDRGILRANYWHGFEPDKLHNSILFFDPDNGFETKTQHGIKWIRHSELQNLFTRLPESSVVVVYQHRPRRKWSDLFEDLREKLDYVSNAVAVHDGSLAFIILANCSSTARRVTSALQDYANRHPVVEYCAIRDSVMVN